MNFDEVDRLKLEYTDKYVMVDASRPELTRFQELVGQVKTINYNGQALVEFQDYHNNTAWYDIGLDYIKVVPKPDPSEKKEKPAKAPAAKAVDTKPAAATKPAAGKSSTADILAAARAKAAGATPAEKPTAAPKPAGKMSTADILAASRAKAASASPPTAVESPAPAATPATTAKPKPAAGPLPKTTDEKIAFCRRVDAKS